jgi:hypothetical protein
MSDLLAFSYIHFQKHMIESEVTSKYDSFLNINIQKDMKLECNFTSKVLRYIFKSEFLQC